MATISWLHLSNLQFHAEADHVWDGDVVLAALLDDVPLLMSRESLELDMILVSGDVAFSGQPDEYDRARAFFDRLLLITGLPKERLFIVPGNHDVDRSRVSPGAHSIGRALTNSDSVNQVLRNPDDLRLMMNRFHAYGALLNEYWGQALPFDPEHYSYARTLDLAHKKVAVLGLNSAWLCASDEDEASRLVLGRLLAHAALEQASSADLRIAMLHHPFDWLRGFDRSEVEPMLCDSCQFVLHGHVRHSELSIHHTPEARTMVIASGARSETQRERYCYNLVKLDLDSHTGYINLRAFSNRRGGFWTDDTMAHRNVRDGKYTFSLRPLLGAPSELRADRKDSRSPRAHFTLRAPEIAYLRRLQRSCSTLPWAVIDPYPGEEAGRQSMDLLPIYITLNTRTAVTGKEEESKDIETRGWAPEVVAQSQDQLPLTALAVAAREPCLVLLGDPGSGKSTFVSHLAVCLAGACLEQAGQASAVPGENWLARLAPAWSHGPLLPLLVTLRHFAQSSRCTGTAKGLLNFVMEQLASQGLGNLARYFDRRLLAGSVMVLLDGLDEVSDSSKRQVVRDAILDLSTTYAPNGNRFLVTCRTYAYQDPLARFACHTLAPLNQEQIEAFVACWYREVTHTGRKSETEAQDLTLRLQAATRRPDLAPLAASPLQLTMMASLHSSWGRLPDDRVELYQKMVDLLLVRWQEARLGAGAGVARIISPTLLETALEEVAFRAHAAQGTLHGTADVSEEVLRKVLSSYVEGSWDRAGDLIRYFQERTGLLIERRPGVYTFPHRSYQEYLAGAHLAVQDDFPDQAAELIASNYSHWREVVLWAVGSMAHLKKMIHVAVDVAAALCPTEVAESVPRDEEWRAALLAGQALLEIGVPAVQKGKRYRPVLTRVQTWLAACISRDQMGTTDRAAAGDLLAWLGDPRFRSDVWYLPAAPMLGFVEIPAGPFCMGSDRNRDTNAAADELQHTVELAAYYIARYPVTVDQFRSFVKAAGYQPGGTWTSDPGLANHPVGGVTWHDARAYCTWLTARLWAWDGTPEPLARLLREKNWQVRLPTEAEWEKAARGADGRIFTCGDQPDWDRANCSDPRLLATSAVGCFPGGASPYGVLDMNGNVWEWCASLYKPYPYLAGDGREDLGEWGMRVLRGGAFRDDPVLVRGARRARYYPDDSYSIYGFRLALAPALL